MAVLLLHAAKKLGPLCPACLAAGPKEACQRVRKEDCSPDRQELLAFLTTRLADMDRWGISLAQLLAREKAHLRGLFPKLTEEELRARVDEPYRAYSSPLTMELP